MESRLFRHGPSQLMNGALATFYVFIGLGGVVEYADRPLGILFAAPFLILGAVWFRGALRLGVLTGPEGLQIRGSFVRRSLGGLKLSRSRLGAFGTALSWH